MQSESLRTISDRVKLRVFELGSSRNFKKAFVLHKAQVLERTIVAYKFSLCSRYFENLVATLSYRCIAHKNHRARHHIKKGLTWSKHCF